MGSCWERGGCWKVPRLLRGKIYVGGCVESAGMLLRGSWEALGETPERLTLGAHSRSLGCAKTIDVGN